MPSRVVIVGGGQGGYQTAASLRQEGWDGEITLIGEEPGLPYQRPPLSKDFLAGKQDARHTELRPAAFYEKNRIDLRTGERVDTIDPAARQVILAGGKVPYDFLILATGARNRTLPVEGAALPHVLYLRTLTEAAAMREQIAAAQRIAIIGGGFIGLEVAASAVKMGKPTTVIESQSLLMARVLAPIVSEYFRATHIAQGVEFRFNATASAITPQGVLLSDATTVDADLVIVGIGVVPNHELARDAGLAITNGISVDEHLRTSNPRIFAIGDCAEFPSTFTGTRIRLESIQNCVDHAVAVAKSITGEPAPYASAPWFWTDQFDIRLQMAGIASQWDQIVVRGNPEERKFSVFYFHQGTLRAVNSINRPAEHLASRKLIATRHPITPAQAADESLNLKEF